MPMPNRNNINNNYRYAYQGQEKDPETGKEAFELRLWDARIGRWLTVDPKRQYASPYLGMGNNPMIMFDPDGGFAFGPGPGDPFDRNEQFDRFFVRPIKNSINSVLDNFKVLGQIVFGTGVGNYDIKGLKGDPSATYDEALDTRDIFPAAVGASSANKFLSFSKTILDATDVLDVTKEGIDRQSKIKDSRTDTIKLKIELFFNDKLKRSAFNKGVRRSFSDLDDLMNQERMAGSKIDSVSITPENE